MALSPRLVIPGSDVGIELALRLSEDLHLKGNPFSMFSAMRDKLTMQETLKAAGLRFIDSRAVASEDEALDFFRTLGSGKVQPLRPMFLFAVRSRRYEERIAR